MKATSLEFSDELTSLAKLHQFAVFESDTAASGFQSFSKLFPDRYFNFGIAEQNIVASACGFSSCGYKVFVPGFASFMIMRAFEQIRVLACLAELDVAFLGNYTGLQVGSEGAVHMALEDVALMRSLPGMRVIQPADGLAAREIAAEALKHHGPLYVRLHRFPVDDVYQNRNQINLDEVNIIRDSGNDVALLSSGTMVSQALKASFVLSDRGIGSIVADIETIKPIDIPSLLDIATRVRGLVTIEDHSIYGGLGSAVLEALSTRFPIQTLPLGVKDEFGLSGASEEIYDRFGLSPSGIADSVTHFVAKLEERRECSWIAR